MSQNNLDIKLYLKKLEQKKYEKKDIEDIIHRCNEILCEFHMYSLGLKYYSYLEREIDFEDDIDEHVHTEQCDHEHTHDDCSYESKVESQELLEAKAAFSDFVKMFAKSAKLPSINELLDIRASLESLVKVLTAYGDQISLLENVYYKTRYNEEQLLSMDSDEAFSKRVVDFLMVNENSAEIREHLKFIYPELPMRMHKNKFLSFLDTYFHKLQGIPIEDVKNHIQIIKESFNPKIVEGYGELVAHINTDLVKVEETLISGSMEEKDSAYHHLYHLTEDKNELLDMALDISELLNHLLGIAISNTDELKKSTVFNRSVNLLDMNTEEELLVSVFEEIENSYEPLGEELTKVSLLIDRLSEEQKRIATYELTLELNELKYAYELTRDGYFIERPHEKESHIPSYKELAMLKSEVIVLMDTTFESEDRMIRRARMSLMMGIFQLVHSTGQEIYDHILNSMASCSSKGEKVMSMQNIYAYINEFME